MGGKSPIYLDYQATTPTDTRVLEAMWPWFRDSFGNAHSAQHAHGASAEAAVEQARAQIAALIGAEAREIVFTSGATESNNLAIKGVLRFHLKHSGRAHLITNSIEHKCVLESARAMEAEGARITVLPVGRDGIVDPLAIREAITEDTVLVSLLAAHNEIGTIQPLTDVGALCREAGVLLHTDAAQATGKIPLDVTAMNIGLMSLSAHKMYGPKGIGALYMRRRPRARLEPLFSGGGQERGVRSGTLPVPLCVGMGEAARMARKDGADEATRQAALRDRLLIALQAGWPGLVVNGAHEPRLPHNLNVTLPGIDALDLLERVRDLVSISTGSACTSASVEPSYVLTAIGLSEDMAASSLRLSVGRDTTEADIDRAAEAILTAARFSTGAAGKGARFAPAS